MSIKQMISKPAKIALATLLASTLLSGPTYADPKGQDVTLDPGKGMSFVVGSKRATTFFHPTAGECEVTLIVSEADPMVNGTYVSGTRLKLKLTPGKVTRIDSIEGKSLSLACDANAKTITVSPERLKVSSLAQ